jgi:pullulanase/glycogen debranching enzyme
VAPTSTATAPSISNINVVINSNEADETQISWYTDTPTMGVVIYGTTSNYGAERTTSFDYSIYHSVFLSGLSPGTTYHYRIQAIDINKGLSFSGDQTFVTPYQTSYSDCYCGYNHYNCYYGSCGSYYHYRTYNRAVGYPVVSSQRHDPPQYDPPQHDPPPPSGPIKEAPTSPPPPSYPVKK